MRYASSNRSGKEPTHSAHTPFWLYSRAWFFSGTAEMRMVPSVPTISVSTW